MNWILKTSKIDDLFLVKSGDFHATKELDPGDVPLISCGDIDNGLVGYYDIPKDKLYRHCLTVAYNGQPLLAKFHHYEFGAKDDVGVLQPRTPMLDSTLLYVSAQINKLKWRYSYGRKCFREKLRSVIIHIPVKDNGEGELVINQEDIAAKFPVNVEQLIPQKGLEGSLPLAILVWRDFV